MRLHFPNKEHADLLVAPGDTTIGAADDNAVVLKRPGIAQRHAVLSVGERGFVLNVVDAGARVHVNARPVREKAIVRLGDMVSLDTLQFMLKPDRDAAWRAQLEVTRTVQEYSGDPTAAVLPGTGQVRSSSQMCFGPKSSSPRSKRCLRGRKTEFNWRQPRLILRWEFPSRPIMPSRSRFHPRRSGQGWISW